MLPQLTVYAKIIYLLMVVISGALCTVEDYVIMSQCAHNKAIYLAAEGTVSVTDISQTQNITIVGRPDFVNNNFKIALYAKETQRYLCFNDHWKLVGMKELQDTCYFNEAILHGYFVFRSAIDQRRRIGFTQRGRAVGPKKVVNDACYMFTKIPTDQFFHQHNQFFQQQQQRASSSAEKKGPSASEDHLGGSGMGHLGRGSGGGRPNRHRNHGKKSKLHSSGGGGGGGSVGPRKRQHQRLQQMSGAGGGDSKNSTYLSSSRQQNNIELGQYGVVHHNNNNHSGKHHNHSQPQSKDQQDKQQQQQQHHHHQAARHHHSSSGSNNDSRRHHHYEQKQKSRAHHSRMRTTTKPPSSSTTTTIASTPLADIPTHYEAEIWSTDSSKTSTTTTTTTTTANHLSTSQGHKHKGRRRKSQHHKHDGFHKTPEHPSTPTTEAEVGEEDDAAYLTTDFSSSSTWTQPEAELSSMAKDFLPVKPTSASLPSWETWYPSSMATTLGDVEEVPVADYTLSSVSYQDAKKLVDTAQASSPLPLNYDISKPLPYSTTATTTTTTMAFSMANHGKSAEDTSRVSENQQQKQRQEDELNNKFKLQLAGSGAPEINNSTSSLSQSEEDSNSSSGGGTALEDDPEDQNEEDDDDDDAEEEEHLNLTTMATKHLSDMPSTNSMMTDYIYATRTVPISEGQHKVSRHRHTLSRHPHNAMQHHKDKLALQEKIRIENGLITTTTTTTSTTTTTPSSELGAITHPHRSSQSLNTFSDLETPLTEITANTLSSTTSSLMTAMPTLATASSSISTGSSSIIPSTSNSPSTSTSHSTTRKSLRKSTQKLLATPFHQLTYVRNEAGDIDIDSLDNISMYPDLEDNENGDFEQPAHRTTSRFTMISGYHHPSTSSSSSSATSAALPESIRIAKIKINRERKRMLRMRNIGAYNA
ncbi:serine-rich adhesin for platelets [Musca vetustissima]|uniref:serine-rich adhesin for platelets n=1 Tax=Musca vetustissima TaxID=27455 RepID=UPI002AB7DC9D|nr:serine-rich adhesin for platelets [Musca vetustissima]